jgi:hypothetical protein
MLQTVQTIAAEIYGQLHHFRPEDRIELLNAIEHRFCFICGGLKVKNICVHCSPQEANMSQPLPGKIVVTLADDATNKTVEALVNKYPSLTVQDHLTAVGIVTCNCPEGEEDSLCEQISQEPGVLGAEREYAAEASMS